MNRKVWLSFAMLAVCGGCAGYQPTPTSTVFEGDNLPFGVMASPESILRSIVERAPFDLNCPPGEVTYTSLGRTAVGVDGCGSRATFKWVDGIGWVMNAASTDQPADAAPAE